MSLNDQYEQLREKWHEIILALCIGLSGSVAFTFLNLPLPWLLGALFATTGATLFGLKLWIPGWLRIISLMVLGALFGSSVKPDFISNILLWLPSMFAMVLYILLVMPPTFLYLRRIVRLDKSTAYFASAPGGLLPMTLFSEEMGGDPKLVSLLQGSRIIVTVAIIPIAFTVFGDYMPSGQAGTGGAFKNLTIIDGLILIGISVFGYLIAVRLSIPTPALMGSMILVALISITGSIKIEIPDSVVAIAQCIMGSSIGSMFGNIKAKVVGKILLHGCIISVFMISLSSLMAYCVHFLSKSSLQALILALAPGGLAEMTLIGFALGIDVAFLVTHQIIRYFLVTIGVPIVFRKIQKIA